jgi:hypothetical protein
VLRESAVPRAEKLLGLQQAGAGLHFPTVQLDVGKGRDARLSDHMPSCLSQKAASFRSRLWNAHKSVIKSVRLQRVYGNWNRHFQSS